MKARVVVAGGGFAGLETLFCLRYKLGNTVDLTLVSDKDYFLFKPNAIYIPFGEDPDKLRVGLEKPALKQGFDLVLGSIRGVDADRRKLLLADRELSYDYLVLATGASTCVDEVPGLREHAINIGIPEQMVVLRDRLQRTVEAARRGERQRILFLLPPNNKCTGPLYELALMIDTWLGRMRDKVEITWTTHEGSYIQAFGPRYHTVVADELEARGIEGHTGLIVEEVRPGKVVYRGGTTFSYDLLICFPPQLARETFSALPHDSRGFIKVSPDDRRVKGQERIFAVGDAADFPIKHAFLALLQADAAAEHLAADITRRKADPSSRFEPMCVCVLEEMNKATFVQEPLKYARHPQLSTALPAGDDACGDSYKVGVSPLWRPGKKVPGYYLPWHFGHGEPFHRGFDWDGIDLGLKVLCGARAL